MQDKEESSLARFRKSLFNAARAFAIVYGARHGISLLLNIIKKKPLHLLYYKSSLQSAMFVSWYTFAYTLLRDQKSKLATFIAGTLAGTGIALESKSNRITLTQQTAVRSLNGLYQVMLRKGFKKIPFLYEAIFGISSGAVMYSFVMWPDTLHQSLIKLMINVSNTPRKMLDFCRAVINRTPIDLIDFQLWMASKRGTKLANDTMQKIIDISPDPRKAILTYIPVEIQHFTMENSMIYCAYLFGKVFKEILPVYSALHVFPRLFLNFKSFVNAPLPSFTGAIRSSVFLAVYVSSFELLFVITRMMFSNDYKPLFFVNGLIASTLAIFCEAPKRRPELGLYVVSKAIHAVYQTLALNKYYPRYKHMDTCIFSMSSGLLMILYEFYPQSLTRLFLTILNRFLIK